MRPLLATACICLLASSGSIASDQKPVGDRFDGGSIAAPIPDALISAADRLSPPDDTFDPLPLAAVRSNPGRTAEAAIDIPEQKDASALLQPRDLPAPSPRAAKPAAHHSRQEICDTIAAAAQRNDLPVPFFIRLLFQESGFRPTAVSRSGAQGIAQFMPETADAVGLDNPFDPMQAIPASARLLRDLFEQFGNLGLAAAAYNAGPKRIHDWLERKGKLPEETQGYVKTITGRPAESWKEARTRTPAADVPRPAQCPDSAGMVADAGAAGSDAHAADSQRKTATPEKHEAKANVKVAAHRHRHRGKEDTVNFAARRKQAHGRQHAAHKHVAHRHVAQKHAHEVVSSK